MRQVIVSSGHVRRIRKMMLSIPPFYLLTIKSNGIAESHYFFPSDYNNMEHHVIMAENNTVLTDDAGLLRD